jgi:hypothetical protein
MHTGSVSEGTDDREALEDALVAAAQAPARNFFKQPGDQDERDHPVLARVVKAVEGETEWRRSPNQAFLRVLRQAIDALDEEMSGRPTRGELTAEARSKEGPWHYTGKWKGSPARRIALILYGELDDDPEIETRLDHEGRRLPFTYNDDYLPAAHRLANVAGRSIRVKQRPIKVIREDLGEALLVMEKAAIRRITPPQLAPVEEIDPSAETPIQGIDAIAARSAPAEPKTPYFPRPDLADRLAEAWRDQTTGQRHTAGRVCVIGDAGTGKTRFIREHTTPDNPIWIDAGADETMLPGMVNTLTRFDVDVAGFDTPRIKHAFGQLLVRVDGPSLVVIDGIPEPAVLDQFIPLATRSRVVVTSRTRPRRDWSPVVDVADMEAEEAAALAAALLPGFTSAEYAALAAILGHRPLLIEHGCRYVQQTGTTDISEYCEAVGQDISAAIDASAYTTDTALTAIYRQYVERLSREAPQSIALLELLCFVAHCNVPPEYAMSYLLGVPYVTRKLLPRAQLAYEAALRQLTTYSLISVRPGYGISMQPLTQRILRSIFDDRFPGVYQRAQPLLSLDDHHPYGQDLYDAGWHMLTVTGRVVCNGLLRIHARQRSLDDSRPSLAGVTGSVQWTVLVTELWKRYYLLMAETWALGPGIHSNHSVGEAGTTKLWLTEQDILALADGLPPIQADEIQAVARDLFDILRDATTSRGLRSFEALAAWVVSPHQESYLGTLDFSVFFPIDSSFRELPESDPKVFIASFTMDRDAFAEFAAMSTDEQRELIDKKHAEFENEAKGVQE